MKNLLPILFLYLLTLVAVSSSSNNDKNNIKCGYDSCQPTDPSKLNIHIVPHTHDDVGWLKTVDQYYYGIHNGDIQRAGIQYILDTVVQALDRNPNRTFMYVETAFFWKWWLRQDDQIKQLTRRLVDTGRLELVSGGWSMNDEGCTHYSSIIDSMTWGHRRLSEIMGGSKCAIPRIGWQIDPFGHSREQASLFAQMFFDAQFFARIDFEDRNLREQEKRMECVWESSRDLGPSSHLLSGLLAKHYNWPNGFCFDDNCSDEPIVDDPESEEYNMDQMVDNFVFEMRGYEKKFSTNHLLVTFGDDFTFANAFKNYMNIDLLIKYVNEKKGNEINVFYSTPSCYVKSLHESNVTWTTKSDDFSPSQLPYMTFGLAISHRDQVRNCWRGGLMHSFRHVNNYKQLLD